MTVRQPEWFPLLSFVRGKVLSQNRVPNSLLWLLLNRYRPIEATEVVNSTLNFEVKGRKDLFLVQVSLLPELIRI
jgi:hypothetical protein